jgi:ABC-type uncharacterized transport system substrate-binding protein
VQHGAGDEAALVAAQEADKVGDFLLACRASVRRAVVRAAPRALADGRTIAIEYRWAEGRGERFAEIAAEFVRLKVDLIIASGTATVVAAKQTTSINPIVFPVAGTRLATASSRVWRDRAATGRKAVKALKAVTGCPTRG